MQQPGQNIPGDWRTNITDNFRQAMISQLFKAAYENLPETRKTPQEKDKVLKMATEFEKSEFGKAVSQTAYIQQVSSRINIINQRMRRIAC